MAAARRVRASVRDLLAHSADREPTLSASSGWTSAVGPEQALELAGRAVGAAGLAGACDLGVDVAAEHLRGPDGCYQWGEHRLGGSELARWLLDACAGYALTYVEDPFDSGETDDWRAFLARRPNQVRVIGDDLFATTAARVDASLADGILLKLTQSGTVTATLDAAARAKDAGMVLAVSHRSGETEDVAMCDLAVATDAHYIKVGGPLRGDRIAKYNQLLRLAEGLHPDIAGRTPRR